MSNTLNYLQKNIEVRSSSQNAVLQVNLQIETKGSNIPGDGTVINRALRQELRTEGCMHNDPVETNHSLNSSRELLDHNVPSLSPDVPREMEDNQPFLGNKIDYFIFEGLGAPIEGLEDVESLGDFEISERAQDFHMIYHPEPALSNLYWFEKFESMIYKVQSQNNLRAEKEKCIEAFKNSFMERLYTSTQYQYYGLMVRYTSVDKSYTSPIKTKAFDYEDYNPFREEDLKCFQFFNSLFLIYHRLMQIRILEDNPPLKKQDAYEDDTEYWSLFEKFNAGIHKLEDEWSSVDEKLKNTHTNHGEHHLYNLLYLKKARGTFSAFVEKMKMVLLQGGCLNFVLLISMVHQWWIFYGIHVRPNVRVWIRHKIQRYKETLSDNKTERIENVMVFWPVFAAKIQQEYMRPRTDVASIHNFDQLIRDLTIDVKYTENR
ncbi:hypothetical protein EDC01DRAFT_730986 [Geopyxis carbonaria]|nr:hypothetical protein EDC01DRAFT_730986 [Geopyxis carbonaria]